MIGVADRLSRIVSEKIELPLREPIKQVGFFASRLEVYLRDLKKHLSAIKNSEYLSKSISLDGLRYSVDLDKNIDYLKRVISPSYQAALGEVMGYVDVAIDDISHAFKMYTIGILRDIGYIEDDLGYQVDSSEITKDDAESVRYVKSTMEEWSKKIEDMAAKLKDFHRIHAQITRSGDTAPPSGDVETMYHASVNAKEILRKGFSDTAPPERIGLGGSVATRSMTGLSADAISFTYDLRVAKEIARAFKEVTMAARGELKAATILSWAKREGIERDVFLSYQSPFNGTKDMNAPHDAVAMYLSYIAWQKRRYNPGFFKDSSSLQKSLSKINPNNIGVVVAKVDMAKARKEGRTHLSAEREIRILPSDIVSIERVI